MAFEKENLDLILVPAGLLIMFAYHLFLLYRYIHRPHTTVIGFENTDKEAWVERVLQADKEAISNALTVIASNTSAATFLCSVCLTLSSLIGAWLGNSSNNFFVSNLIYGDTRQSTMSIKYICILTCFFIAFCCFVQSARNFVHANYLITTPNCEVPMETVKLTVLRGGEFWSLGLRSLYFALDLILWFFGPIPMFVSSVIMVFILYYLDTNTKPLHYHQNLNTHKASSTSNCSVAQY
ncbi:uncharacterized protein LOC105774820 [Gossypium raimondii]|uniref:Uncharacterized protein n=2 Tax=Gossypium raimondii TaxID=29730 RepID=A0A0D2VEF8_GOSRA|nr:uncharacterized protein LOC105774820 [Gossypium raimondii]KJB68290.1 hypothetical protein B456_010G243400 [Gossypium raimondii]